MSQAHRIITPAWSGPPSGVATAAGSDPSSNSNSAAKNEAKRLENGVKLAEKIAKAGPTTFVGEGKEIKVVKEEVAPFINTTPKGQKKDLSGPMAASYDPIAIEATWYDWWLEQGFFKPVLDINGRSKPGDLFVISAPPPSLNGDLHVGHALGIAIEDVLIRWYRMLGKTTLLVPGFDHASISAQVVVEKRLLKSSGTTRQDLGHEKFLETMVDWKNECQERITNQLHGLGGSYDWSRVAFTMDDQLSKAVVEAFCRLHDEGVIYRANRLVNWCVRLKTTISNIEVHQKQLEKRTFLSVPGYDPEEKFEFGVVTSFAYPIENSDERIIVATTRPETMLGDTAIAVHPDDVRYKHLHGKFAVHPFADRRIPIVTDGIAVDMALGTGAVKITPAHDANDYDTGMRHKLEFINILNDDGTLNANAGPGFQGMKRFHARVEVVRRLKDLGLYIGAEESPMQIPICSKSGDIIEPTLKPQWWVDCKSLAEEAIKSTRAGELQISPKQLESDWFGWLENIEDWCISRQLWWGHRCPAYFVRIEGQEQENTGGKYWVVGRDQEEAMEKAKKLAGSSNFTLEQDDDVLDTWFSAGLWPFSIFGWPDKTPDFENFYPTSMLETGYDILFYWVARMVMLGIRLTGKVPFSEVLCHGLIRDANGRKMSKSVGNVIDPLDVTRGVTLEELHEKLDQSSLDAADIEKVKLCMQKDFPKGIPQCSADALRFALCAYSGSACDINVEILREEGYRTFCNKVFNVTKFAMLKLDKSFRPKPTQELTGNESLIEQWILHKLNIAAAETNKQLSERNLTAATNAVQTFWLYELGDVYIEAMKSMADPSAPTKTRHSAQQTLYTCLDQGLRLLHPFMPFMTEELWQRLSRRPNDTTPSIMVSRYPTYEKEFAFEEASKQFDLLVNAVQAGCSLAASYNLRSDIQTLLCIQDDNQAALFESQKGVITTLTKGSKSVEVVRDVGEIPQGCRSSVVTSTISVHIIERIRGVIDLDVEISKCEKKLLPIRLNLDKVKRVEAPSDCSETAPQNVKRRRQEENFSGRDLYPGIL